MWRHSIAILFLLPACAAHAEYLRERDIQTAAQQFRSQCLRQSQEKKIDLSQQEIAQGCECVANTAVDKLRKTSFSSNTKLSASDEEKYVAITQQSSRDCLGPKTEVGYPSVSAALATLRRDPSANIREEGGWTIVNHQTGKNEILWTFTHESHSAHPAVVKRTVFEKDGQTYIDMKILCQAEKTACDKLAADFTALNERLREDLRHRAQQGAAGTTPQSGAP